LIAEDNPYAVGLDHLPATDAWKDGDVEFTEREIRTPGDIALPRICIRSGRRDELQLRKRYVGTVATAYLWIWRVFAVAMVACAVVLDAQGAPGMLTFVAIPIVITIRHLVTRLCATHAIQIVWFISRPWLASLKRRRSIATRSLVVLAIAVIALYSLRFLRHQELFMIGFAVLCLAVLVSSAPLLTEPQMTPNELMHGRFVLKGHRPEFAHAWANDLQDRQTTDPETVGSSVGRRRSAYPSPGLSLWLLCVRRPAFRRDLHGTVADFRLKAGRRTRIDSMGPAILKHQAHSFRR